MLTNPVRHTYVRHPPSPPHSRRGNTVHVQHRALGSQTEPQTRFGKLRLQNGSLDHSYRDVPGSTASAHWSVETDDTHTRRLLRPICVIGLNIWGKPCFFLATSCLANGWRMFLLICLSLSSYHQLHSVQVDSIRRVFVRPNLMLVQIAEMWVDISLYGVDCKYDWDAVTWCRQHNAPRCGLSSHIYIYALTR